MSDGALEDSPAPFAHVVDVTAFMPVPRWRHLRKTVARIGGTALAIILFTAAMIALLAPPAIFLFSGLWSAVASISGVWTLWHEVKTWRIADVFASIVAVDTSTRFAVAGISFFAIIFSFIVLFAGLLGRRWQHMFVVPGILLGAPSVVTFTFAATLSFSVLASHSHLPGWLQYPLLGYALLDALLLAALLLDLRPSTRRNWLRRLLHRRKRFSDDVEVSMVPLPVVRFGPTQPLTNVDPSGALAHPPAVTSSTVSSEADTVIVVSRSPEVILETTSGVTIDAPAMETTAGVQAENDAVVAASSLAL